VSHCSPLLLTKVWLALGLKILQRPSARCCCSAASEDHPGSLCMLMNLGSGRSFGNEVRGIDLVMVCVQVSEASTTFVRSHENHDKIHQQPEGSTLLEQTGRLDLQVNPRKKETIRDDGEVLLSKWGLIDHSTSSYYSIDLTASEVVIDPDWKRTAAVGNRIKSDRIRS
jgi:hypothetical protein